MLVAKLSDQLGNQMFAYAAVKTIALDLGYKFGLVSQSNKEELSNDIDNIFGNKIDTIFEIPKTEKLLVIPQNFKFYQENTTFKCKSAFKEEALNVANNTLMGGHYICPKYFEHRISEVRKWFQFPHSIEEKVNAELIVLRNKYKDHLLVSIHFRNADDYKNGGFLLNSSYWHIAAHKVLKQKDIKPIFVVFYDKRTKRVTEFLSKFQCEEMRGSLVHDMCAISKCDIHIICNSSFSIMAALLDNKLENKVIRPSSYPIPGGYFPNDCFLPNWEVVSGRKDIYSEMLRLKQIYKSRIKAFIKRKKYTEK